MCIRDRAISIINSLVNAINIDDSLLDIKAEAFEDDIDQSKRNTLLRLKKFIQTQRGGKEFKIGFVFPMPGIRGTVKNVFKECGNGLVSEMVIGPTDVIKEDYDILFVDESHRLSKRKNLTGYKSFDDVSRLLDLEPTKTNQLEWVLKSAKHIVLFYDKSQSVKSVSYTHLHTWNSVDRYRRYKL